MDNGISSANARDKSIPLNAHIIDLPQRLARLLALTRLALSAVEDRRNYFGKMQAGMGDVQVSVTLLYQMHAGINDADGIDTIASACGGAWLHLGGLLGLLDAQTWRMVNEHAQQPPEDDLADLEHGLRQAVELAERTLTAATVVETREAEHA